ncbi:MAG: peptide chain release factor 2 [Gemmatimonadetes bacterium]|nr:peptide chain release factor 2 [Gemmatimonadota bacterium]
MPDVREIEQELESSRTRIDELEGYLDISKRIARIAQLEEKMTAQDFWDHQAKAQETTRALSSEKRIVDEFTKVKTVHEETAILLEMAQEESDEETMREVEKGLRKLTVLVSDLETKSLLGAPEDSGNAIININPGAGGTESQDWAQMLLRMYQRWGERRGFKQNLIDISAGDEAGIKSATLEMEGDYAYGFLRSEAGVHRLVRISPFDAAHRRHTSFASVAVFPESEEIEEVEILDSDLRVDTFRSSGAGGQHVNKTDSAVRITHLPTNIVVTCQSERSQHRNRANAMKVLKARLLQQRLEEEAQKSAEREGEKKEIAFGNQIRSYVFQPYTLVKDHRTNTEVGNVQGVMDGDIEPFIEAYLRRK